MDLPPGSFVKSPVSTSFDGISQGNLHPIALMQESARGGGVLTINVKSV